jgi:hypothetical protein
MEKQVVIAYSALPVRPPLTFSVIGFLAYERVNPFWQGIVICLIAALWLVFFAAVSRQKLVTMKDIEKKIGGFP